MADGGFETAPAGLYVAEEVVQVDEVEVLHAEALEGAVDGGLRVGVFGGSALGGAVAGRPKVPKPRAGILAPLLRVMYSMSVFLS